MNTDRHNQGYSSTLEDVLEILKYVRLILKNFLQKKLTFKDLRELFKSISNLNSEAVNRGETSWILESLHNQFKEKI